MTLAVVAVVCLTLLVLQREGLKYLREYHGAAKHLADLDRRLVDTDLALRAVQGDSPQREKVAALERRIKDLETLTQAQRIARK
jgi:hypothetical protein